MHVEVPLDQSTTGRCNATIDAVMAVATYLSLEAYKLGQAFLLSAFLSIQAGCLSTLLFAQTISAAAAALPARRDAHSERGDCISVSPRGKACEEIALLGPSPPHQRGPISALPIARSCCAEKFIPAGSIPCCHSSVEICRRYSSKLRVVTNSSSSSRFA